MLTNNSFVLLGLGVLAGLWYERDAGLGFGLLCGNDIGYWYGSLVWLARGEEDCAVYTFFFVQLCWFWEYPTEYSCTTYQLESPWLYL